MLLAHVLDVAQPVVHQADAQVVEHRLDAAAAVVAHHQDVLHVQHIDGVLQH
ncbi:hypothetical protein SDC9_201963 [bioreactor metagenome]|uniref:Uncharacterized protein n=1 Tax=bioreactor metagenome TaxID=1076179 RepID=A0A645J480_9ZZZZ